MHKSVRLYKNTCLSFTCCKIEDTVVTIARVGGEFREHDVTLVVKRYVQV